MVSPDGGGFSAATDRALARLGRTRRVALSVPHFLFMLDTLANSDLVAVLPERLVRNAPQLRVLAPPLEIEGFDIRCCGTSACIAIPPSNGCASRLWRRCKPELSPNKSRSSCPQALSVKA